MRRSNHTVQTIAFLAAMGLSASAWANGSASTVITDPFTGEIVSTITSVSNPDGSHTVTERSPDGKVISQVTTTTDTHTGIRTVTQSNEDGTKTITITDAQGEVIRVVQVAAEPAGSAEGGSENTDNYFNTFDNWIESGGAANETENGDSENSNPQAGATEDGELSNLELAEQILEEFENLELGDLKYEIEHLKRQHRDLLDEAGRTEDEDEFRDLVKSAQDVMDKLEAAEDAYFDKLAELDSTPTPQEDGVGGFPGTPNNNDIRDHIVLLEELVELIKFKLKNFPPEDDEEYDELEAEAEKYEIRIGELEEEYERLEEERKEEGDQRKLDRQNRQTQIGSLHRMNQQNIMRSVQQNAIRNSMRQNTVRSVAPAPRTPSRTITLRIPSGRS